MRASLWQMSASALGFKYRLLRRAVACGTFLKFHSSFTFIDQILLSLSDSLLFLCSLVSFYLTSFSWISAMDLYLAANTRQDEDVSILDYSSSYASRILYKRRSSSAITRVAHQNKRPSFNKLSALYQGGTCFQSGVCFSFDLILYQEECYYYINQRTCTACT